MVDAPEILARGAELAEQAAAEVVAVEEGELVQAGAGEAADGGVLQPGAVEAEAPQARVARHQRAEQVVRERHLLKTSTKITEQTRNGRTASVRSIQQQLLP